MRTQLIAHSRQMRALLAELKRFAATDANVLVLGETGAGKDLVARALHAAGPRRDEPFIAIDGSAPAAGVAASPSCGRAHALPMPRCLLLIEPAASGRSRRRVKA